MCTNENKLSIILQVIRERGGPAFSEEEERGEGGEGGSGPPPDGGQVATVAETAADGQPEQGAEVGRETGKEAALGPDHPDEV